MRYGLIGARLSYSYSKIIHEQLADYTYDLIPLNEKEFHSFMKKRDFNAINVTIPYKKAVLPYLDEISPQAKKLGAVNTIVNRDGCLTGYNTDYDGFRYTLLHNHIDPKGQKVMVLGYGGASLAILQVLRDLKAGEIVIVNRTIRDGAISYEEAKEKHLDASLLINTTSVGTSPNIDASPMDLSSFHSLTAVVDIIYNPTVTKLLGQASVMGVMAINGLDMLVAQAKYAVEHFLGIKIPEERIEEVKRNVAIAIKNYNF